MIKLTSQIIRGYSVNISIDVSENDAQVGYGYGLSIADFFNVFGVPGENRGYFIEDMQIPIEEGSLYTFGIGAEYSTLFPQDGGNKTITLYLDGEDIPDGTKFDLYVLVRMIGGSSEYVLQEAEVRTFIPISISKTDSNKNLHFSDLYNESLYINGLFSIEDKDSFIDVVAYIKDVQDEVKSIKTTASIVEHDDSLLKIKIFGGINNED